ncbi:MAG: tRNA (N6-isopentenyl adenosine(37)-C2)-methylthiotransferase MiaB [Defluviitaleaceae bacterium]|nr:tRNA (N6-isopentenyl adenosine(37)-C2)-methylthiotransferase MiaB [Defluviitaleaceae bacterium]
MDTCKKTTDLEFYIKKIKTANEIKNIKPKAFIVTFGCQMNARDSEKLKGMLDAMGYEMVKSENDADLVIFNTCCVRENAENRVFGRIGSLKSKKAAAKANGRDFKILLCGCMMQQDIVIEKIRQSYSFVDIIFGTFNLHRLPQLLWDNMESNSMIVDIWEGFDDSPENLPSIREYKHRASVNIMYGCDNFCTYCIVPYVRGRERSRPAIDILTEIKELVDDGVVEIMLLGQNVNSYGKGLEENINFAGLLHKINEIPGILRIRFMTSHPKDLSDNLIAAMRDIDIICKHLHLPFQAGSNRILEIMNRRYTKEQYIALIDKIRREIPNIAITTDIMVGFPTETEEDFADTLDIVKKARFANAFTFYYSKREGTAAAAMENQIDEKTAKERFERLLCLVNDTSAEISQEKIGKIVKVIIDSIGKDGFLNGRSDDNFLVHVRGNSELVGKMFNVKIIEAKSFYLIGEIQDFGE